MRNLAAIGIAITLTGAAMPAMSAAVDFTGATLQISDAGIFTFDPSNTFMVGAGPEVSAIDSLSSFVFDFSATGLLSVEWIPNASNDTNVYGVVPVGDGFIVTDAGGNTLPSLPDITGFRLIDSRVGYEQADLSFTADSLKWDFTGVELSSGTVLTAQIEVSEVPLPAPLSLMGAGLLAWIGLRRRTITYVCTARY